MATLCLRIIGSSQAVELTQSISKVMLKLSLAGRSVRRQQCLLVGWLSLTFFNACVRDERH